MRSVVTGVAKHVVVSVDDDFRVRESIERLVDTAGYAPLVFSSAEDFLDSGTLAGATCLITDVRMPGMDGIKLQRRVRLERPK
jgi:FixJ family two-component response regulator